MKFITLKWQTKMLENIISNVKNGNKDQEQLLRDILHRAAEKSPTEHLLRLANTLLTMAYEMENDEATLRENEVMDILNGKDND